MRNYKVKEIYYTIQGEGFHSGRAAVFCRFAGCNLWSGRVEDRQSAICKFCDTDFVGMDGDLGGTYSAKQLADTIVSLMPNRKECMVVFTGGEPLLQLDKVLTNVLHHFGCYLAVETNGTLNSDAEIDWICVSPKANSPLALNEGNELKLVYPQIENSPSDFEHLAFDHFYIQPLEDEHWEENIKRSVDFVKNHPKWKLSLQTHKMINIP